MQGGGCWTTSTDREIWFNTSYVVVLLATENEKAFKLAFTHSWATIFHHVAVRLGGNLTRPPQSKDFFIIFDNSRFAQDIMHSVKVDSQIANVSLFRDLSLKFAIAVDSSVNINSCVCAGCTLCRHKFLQLVNSSHFDLVLGRVIFFGHHCHPNFIQGVQLGNEEDSFLFVEVKQAVAVHFNNSKQVVKERFLVRRIAHVTAVQWYLRGALKKRDRLVLSIYLHFLLEKPKKARSILLE